MVASVCTLPINRRIDLACSNKTLYQVGVLSGFVDKVYDGDCSVLDLSKHGDFGIGTFNAVHGELIAFDGKFYRAIEDGVARLVTEKDLTPFGWVVDFEETQSFNCENVTSFDHFSDLFDQEIKSKNYIYAYRIDCLFEHIDYRTEACQPKPYRPLIETFPEVQVNHALENVQATIAGFRFPNYMATLNIPGHHMHVFCDSEKMAGHVFNLSFKQARVSVCCIKNYNLAMIESNAFESLQIDVGALSKATHAVEKQR